MDDKTLRAWAYLSKVAEPPCDGVAALVSDVGPVEAAERISRAAVDPDLAEHTAARREIDTAAADLDNLRRRNGRLVTPDDAEWPLLGFAAFGGSALRNKPRSGPPMVLWVIGPARLDDVSDRAAAIVGTRASTAYGNHIAADFAAGLVDQDVAVVSGGAIVL